MAEQVGRYESCPFCGHADGGQITFYPSGWRDSNRYQDGLAEVDRVIDWLLERRRSEKHDPLNGVSPLRGS